ncbi:hypothetical protein FRC03_009823 [Tulasnella sp. 419]|nr:hypothetical protein FRC03_009823 [Tulasnella sp. 419]
MVNRVTHNHRARSSGGKRMFLEHTTCSILVGVISWDECELIALPNQLRQCMSVPLSNCPAVSAQEML